MIAAELENGQAALDPRYESSEQRGYVVIRVTAFVGMGEQAIWPHAVDSLHQPVEQLRHGIDRPLVGDPAPETMMRGNPTQAQGAT